MFVIKEILALTTFLILSAIGLTEISKSDSKVSSNIQLQNQSKNSSVNVLLTQSSDEFFYYLDIIQNKPIDKEKVQAELNSFSSEFEKTFLSALLKKRAGEFENS